VSAPPPVDPHDDALRHEQFISEVLRIRKGEEKSKSTLTNLLTSSVVAAAVTVLGTAVVGNFITNAYQAGAKRNDAIVQYVRDKRAARDGAVNKALQIVGAYVTAIEDLVHITSPEFRSEGRPPAEMKKLDDWKETIQAAHDKADTEWRRERDTTRFTLAFQDTEGGSLQQRWAELATAVDSLEDCGRGWFMQHAWGDTAITVSPCASKRESVNTAMDHLVRALQQSEKSFFDTQMRR
jgi:hypothetical protein